MSFGAFGASAHPPSPAPHACTPDLAPALAACWACSCVRRARVAGPSACLTAEVSSEAPSPHNSFLRTHRTRLPAATTTCSTNTSVLVVPPTCRRLRRHHRWAVVRPEASSTGGVPLRHARGSSHPVRGARTACFRGSSTGQRVRWGGAWGREQPYRRPRCAPCHHHRTATPRAPTSPRLACCVSQPGWRLRRGARVRGTGCRPASVWGGPAAAAERLWRLTSGACCGWRR